MPVNWKRIAIAAVFGVAVALLLPYIAPPLLGALGFGALGPAAGSLAAGIQAGIGNVATGSAFALAQSIAMGGAFPAAISAVGGAVVGAATYLGLRVAQARGSTGSSASSNNNHPGSDEGPRQDGIELGERVNRASQNFRFYVRSTGKRGFNAFDKVIRHRRY